MFYNFLKASHHFYQKNINLFCLLSTLNVSTYPLILGIIKTNDFTALSKYLIKYLELVFALTNFEMTILSTLTSEIFIGFLQHKTF